MQNQETLSFYKVIQNNVDKYLKHINLTSRDVIAYISIFGLSFLFGLLCKRYGSYIVSWIIATLLLVSIMQYYEIVVINTFNLKSLLGMEDIHSLDGAVTEMKHRMSNHGIECVVGLCAIILGFKLG